MSGFTTKVSWGYAFIPLLLGAMLLYVVSLTSSAMSNDDEQIARKLQNGYVILGDINGDTATRTLSALNREGVSAVISRENNGRCRVLAPEEEAEDGLRFLTTHAASTDFRAAN